MKTKLKPFMIIYLIALSTYSNAMKTPITITTDKALELEIIKKRTINEEELDFLKKHLGTIFGDGPQLHDCTIVTAQTKIEKTIVGIALFDYNIDDAKIINLQCIGVKDTHQKQGIGKSLIDFIASTTQCKKITLISTPDAVMFYIRIGFFKESIGLSKNFF